MSFNKAPSSILQCPVCKSTLIRHSAFYRCTNNHHFDQSRNGYNNLLLANQKRSNNPGDSKEMIQARFDFLTEGYYQPIANEINNCLKDLKSFPSTIVDIDCGVGYYLDFIKQNNTQLMDLWGIDISKEAIKKAATAYFGSASWLVSSTKNLPFINKSIDCVLSVFAPLYPAEVTRILRKQGFVLTITPAANHLIEYRKQLFDEIKEIDEYKIQNAFQQDFSLGKIFPIHYKIQPKGQDGYQLLRMTPYYWKSKPQQQEILEKIITLETVTVDVALHVFQKK